MARPKNEESPDPEVNRRRSMAKLQREVAEARRAKVRADLAEGRVIELEDARRQIMALASGVRHALDLAPSYLPSNLQPHEREACSLALRSAISQAMIHVVRKEQKQ